MTKKPAQPQDKYVLRLPDGMRDRLKDAAADAGRSMNAEIVQRLEESLDGGLASKIADAAFFRGIQIGLVETIFSEDDPVKALHDLRERLRQPMKVGGFLAGYDE